VAAQPGWRAPKVTTELTRDAVLGMVRQAGEVAPGHPGHDPVVEAVGEWKSFRATLHRYTVTGWPHDLAVKVGDDWGPGDARFVYEEMERIRAWLIEADTGAVGLRPIGWLDDPPAVAMPFVVGSSVSDAIRDAGVSNASEDAERAVAAARAFGAALGSYHGLYPAHGDDSVDEVRADFAAAARRALVPGRAAWDRAVRLARARGYRLSPNDLLVAEDGSFVFLDPPHIRVYELVHRDVSAFFVELDTVISHNRLGKTNTGLEHRLRSAFLEGYGATGPAHLDTPDDRWAIRLYECSRIVGIAYGHLRRRRFGRGARSTVRALRFRLSLGVLGMRRP
jgi:hypothetical protein